MKDITREELAAMRGTPSWLETLTILVEYGPCEPGDLLHTDVTNDLVRCGYAAPIVVRLDDGWYAATMRGRDMYKRLYETSLGGLPNTMKEAYANRRAAEALKRAAK